MKENYSWDRRSFLSTELDYWTQGPTSVTDDDSLFISTIFQLTKAVRMNVDRLSSYYNSANLCPSVCLSFDFHGNRSHGALRARPMRCSEPDDVLFLFEFVLMWSSYTIKRLCVVFASLHCQRCCRIPPTVSQEKCIPQLIARGLPFNQKLHRLSITVH